MSPADAKNTTFVCTKCGNVDANAAAMAPPCRTKNCVRNWNPGYDTLPTKDTIEKPTTSADGHPTNCISNASCNMKRLGS